MFRLWILFVALWAAVFGFQAYEAYVASEAAHDEAQGSRVMGNLLEAGGRTVEYDDPNFGEAAVEANEQLEASTKADWDKAITMLLGGLFGGSIIIAGIYWVIRGAFATTKQK